MIVVLKEHSIDEADTEAMLHAPLDADAVEQRHEERKARDDAT